MPSFEAIIAVTVAGLALSLTPGPSMLYVLSRSVGQSKAAGLASAVGLCVGGVLLAVATAFGLAEVFERSAWLVPAMKYAGSLYLFWLGVGMIRNAGEEAQPTVSTMTVDNQSLSRIAWQGVVVEVLNPKTVLFFALFLPPFLGLSTGDGQDVDLRFQLLALGIIVPLTAIPMDIVVAFSGGSLAGFLNGRGRMRTWLAWLCGGTIIAIAANIHLPV